MPSTVLGNRDTEDNNADGISQAVGKNKYTRKIYDCECCADKLK